MLVSTGDKSIYWIDFSNIPRIDLEVKPCV